MFPRQACDRRTTVPTLFAMILSEPLHPVQIAAYRRMSGQQKYQLTMSFYSTAQRIKTQSITEKHPDWSPTEIREAVKRAIHHGNI